MQFTLTILALASAASALFVPRASNELKVFTLSAPGAPSPIAKLGNASWNGKGNAAGGKTGWFKHDTELKIFIQNNKLEGIAFDSTNTARELVLKKPAGKKDRRELVLGQPKKGDKTKKFTIDMFAVDPEKPPTVAFGYNNRYLDIWSACGSKAKGYTLWFGKDASKGEGCTDQFTLEATYLD